MKNAKSCTSEIWRYAVHMWLNRMPTTSPWYTCGLTVCPPPPLPGLMETPETETFAFLFGFVLHSFAYKNVCILSSYTCGHLVSYLYMCKYCLSHICVWIEGCVVDGNFFLSFFLSFLFWLVCYKYTFHVKIVTDALVYM